MASPRIIMKLTVTAARKEPGDVLVIDLKHPRKPALPAFEAGSHVDVHLPEGKVRQYSLCGDPTELGRYTIAVKRENDGRGGSAWIHETIAVGSTLPVSAPRNHFALKPGEGPTLLLAGGIGITPILAMARALTRQAKPFELHYFTRSRALTHSWQRSGAIFLAAMCGSISTTSLRPGRTSPRCWRTVRTTRRHTTADRLASWRLWGARLNTGPRVLFISKLSSLPSLMARHRNRSS